MAPDVARVLWLVQTGKTLGDRARSGACVTHVPADRCSSAGSSRDEWFGMQLTVSSFDFCLPASRGRLEVPRMSTWCGALAGCPDIRLSERPPAHAGKCRHV